MNPETLYDTDFYEWTVRNAELLRSGRADEADLNHIAEELEDMGRREKRELLSRLAVLIGHLLKWQAQPDLRSKSWSSTIELLRWELADLLAEMPSLRPYLAAALGKAHERAVLAASVEAQLPVDDFPATCPFTLDALLDENYLP